MAAPCPPPMCSVQRRNDSTGSFSCREDLDLRHSACRRAQPASMDATRATDAILIMTNRDREALELLFTASTVTPLQQSPPAIQHRQLDSNPNRGLRVCSTPP